MDYENGNSPDPKILARRKLAARRLRIATVRKKVGVLGATLAIVFSGAVAAAGATGSSLAKGPESVASTGSSSQGQSPTVVWSNTGTQTGNSYGQQTYQPSPSTPVQTAQS